MSLAQYDLEPVGLGGGPENDDTQPYDRYELSKRLAEQIAVRPPVSGLRAWLAERLDAVAIWIWECSETLRMNGTKGR